MYYPTDVAIYKGKLFVADAYNNRVQVFDLKGNSLQIIGAKDGIRVATGIGIAHGQIFVTDFEGNRILIYDLRGRLQQVLDKDFIQPTDIAVAGSKLYVVNYGKNSLSVFSKNRD